MGQSGDAERAAEAVGIANPAAGSPGDPASAERTLPGRNAFLDLIASSAEEGLCAFDAGRRIVFSNPSAQRMLGWDEPELLGRNLHDTLHGCGDLKVPDLPQHDDVARVLLRGEAVRRHYDTFIRRDGSTFPVSYTAAPIIEGERVTGGVLAFHDITQLTRTQEQLQQLNETLEQRVAERTAEAEAQAKQLQLMATEMAQAEQRERRRVGKMLHDHVQQLLVGIRMRLSALAGSAGTETAKAVAEAEDLLIQVIEAARSLSTEIAPPVLYELGLNAALEWLTRWAAQRYWLHVELETDAGAEIANEPLRVMVFDAVRELLVNVVKHAGVDEARIHFQAGEDRIRITVEDFGCGFDPASVQQNRSRTGHGLLSLEQRLELMGGQIHVESEPGIGTRIEITVPLDRAEAVPEEVPPVEDAVASESVARFATSEDFAGDELRVLLIDDHEVVREGLANLIAQQAQMRVVGEASTGEKGVELAGQLQPDVVVMDISLPGISGIEATRQIKRHHPAVQVIGLSMHEERDVAEGVQFAGASAFVSKARSAEQLLTAIHDLLPHGPTATG